MNSRQILSVFALILTSNVFAQENIVANLRTQFLDPQDKAIESDSKTIQNSRPENVELVEYFKRLKQLKDLRIQSLNSSVKTSGTSLYSHQNQRKEKFEEEANKNIQERHLQAENNHNEYESLIHLLTEKAGAYQQFPPLAKEIEEEFHNALTQFNQETNRLLQEIEAKKQELGNTCIQENKEIQNSTEQLNQKLTQFIEQYQAHIQEMLSDRDLEWIKENCNNSINNILSVDTTQTTHKINFSTTKDAEKITITGDVNSEGNFTNPQAQNDPVIKSLAWIIQQNPTQKDNIQAGLWTCNIKEGKEQRNSQYFGNWWTYDQPTKCIECDKNKEAFQAALTRYEAKKAAKQALEDAAKKQAEEVALAKAKAEQEAAAAKALTDNKATQKTEAEEVLK